MRGQLTSEGLSTVPGVEIVASAGGGVIIRSRSGIAALAGASPDRVRAIIDAVQQKDSVGTLTKEDRGLLDSLVKLGALERRTDHKLPCSIAVVGSGLLGTAIAQTMAGRGMEVEHAGFEPSDWIDPERLLQHDARNLPGGKPAAEAAPTTAETARDAVAHHPALLVVAVEGVPYEGILRFQRAAAEAGTPILFVSVESNQVVVGPLFIAGQTACFACRQLAALSASGIPSSEAIEALPFFRAGTLAREEDSLLEAVADTVAAAAPNPTGLLTRAVLFSRAGIVQRGSPTPDRWRGVRTAANRAQNLWRLNLYGEVRRPRSWLLPTKPQRKP